VLLFQADGILCSASARKVEDSLDYDFVGAPGTTGGFNGGLSLCNRSMALDTVKSNNFQVDSIVDSSVESEDLWFQKNMREFDFLRWVVSGTHRQRSRL
jgi:hypothetical protein